MSTTIITINAYAFNVRQNWTLVPMPTPILGGEEFEYRYIGVDIQVFCNDPSNVVNRGRVFISVHTRQYYLSLALLS